jgi:predicted DsbA family dithiol-disulfide isomerase
MGIATQEGARVTTTDLPEIWEWAEYYCPWCYVTAVRLRESRAKYDGRVQVRMRAFPLEVYGSGPAPRDILAQEWWLAAIQEPKAEFAPWTGDDWPTTTLPAFAAFWAANQQDKALALDYDLRIRHAFFAESRNIGRREVLIELAEAVGLNMAEFLRVFESGTARDAVLEEGRLGRETYGVRGTPTVMLADGSRLRPPLAFPKFVDDRIVSIGHLPCHGAECYAATDELFEKALRLHAPLASAE